MKVKDTIFPYGVKTMMGVGSPALKDGISISRYSFKQNMSEKKLSMYSADGDFLIVPQMGTLLVTTELGRLRVQSQEIIVIPRGVKFSVDLEEGSDGARGWMAEVFKGHF